MPPKKADKNAGGKKPSASKIVEDKTFGMKNKKGAQQQKQIAQMRQSAAAGGTPEEKKKAAEKAQRERDKAAAEAALKETAELFKPVQVQKVPFGVDPKTVVCQFFKKGHCEKGKKCKFSHDLNVERKTTKKDLYQDTREEEEAKKRAETSEDWDEEKLKSVVLSKKGNQQTTTDKVCKYFIESERHKLTGTLTPVTPESFAKWKRERMDKKAAEDEARLAKEATGRAMFEKGDWEASGDEDDEDDGDDDTWNMEKLRQETEALREKKEAERIAGYSGGALINGLNGVLGNVEPDIEGANDKDDATGSSS